MGEMFFVPDERLSQLTATRSGRISYSGYNYQCGYAVSRLASMVTSKPLFGLKDYPNHLRYDWGEDLDEVIHDGSVCFTQCKLVDDIGQPAKLANVLLGFAPKWWWTPIGLRERVSFRLVSCDPRFQSNFYSENERASVFDRFRRLWNNDEPSLKSDTYLLRADANTLSAEELFDALWSKLSFVFVERIPDTDDPAGALFKSEAEARDLLLRYGLATSSTQKKAIMDLRCLINANLIEFNPTSNECPSLPLRTPITIDAADVRYALSDKRENRRLSRFTLVDRVFLSKARARPKEMFLFKSPEWRHVVHGTDREIKFVERDQTSSLQEKVRELLIQPILSGTSNVPVLFVTGPPGAGKSTLVRSVAAKLVESGEAVVADAGLNLAAGPLDVQSYAEDLQELSGMGRPVLLVLDDPLFEDSGWIKLLIHLKQSGFPVSAIAATPDFLYERHQGQLSTLSCAQFRVLPPNTNEKECFVEIYGRDVTMFPEDFEDFLVMVAEIGSGEQFSKIVRRVWQTLNGGRSFDDDLSFNQLPWEVRAFWFVSLLHRHYTVCPLNNLKLALEFSGGTNLKIDVETALAKLKSQTGWSIFLHRASKKGGTGEFISTAHQRIASEAWNQRPMKWFDSEINKILAQSTLVEPDSLKQIALAAGTMAKTGQQPQTAFARELIQQWSMQSQQIETRYLCDLVAIMIANGGGTLIGPMRQILEARTVGKDGWMAAFSLLLMSSYDEQSPSTPEQLDLRSLIAVADFSIAPDRAMQFFQHVSKQRELCVAVYKRVLESLEHQDWEVDSSSLIWVLSHALKTDISNHLPYLRGWLKSHDENSIVRSLYLSILRNLPSAFDEQRQQAVNDTAEWLKRHDENGEVRKQYLGFLRSLPSAFDEQRKQALSDTAEWLKRHDENGEVRKQYLGFLQNLPSAFDEQRKQALSDTAEWLRAHQGNAEVRKQYLSFVQGLPSAFDEQRRQAVTDTAEWLKGHDDNAQVLQRYLSFLQSLPSAFDEQRQQAVNDTAEWLKRHEDNAEVRKQYLNFLQALPASFDEQRRQAVIDTAAWLKRHDMDSDVRRQYLSLLGAPSPALDDQREHAVVDSADWLRRYDENVEVRRQYLAFLHALPPAFDEQRKQFVSDTADWLKRHDENSDVRKQYLSFLQSPQPAFDEQRQQAVTDTSDWLKRHDENAVVRKQYLSFLQSLPPAFDEQRQQAVIETAAWLKRHDEDSEVRRQYLTLLLSLPSAFDEHRKQAVTDTAQWLTRHDQNAEVLKRYSSLLQSLPAAVDEERRPLS